MRIKPKQLKGKDLSGRMLVDLAHQYVSVVNTGGVPNIETAWTYICINECQKALLDAHKLFEETCLEQELPCRDEAL